MLACRNGAGLQSGEPAWLADWRARRARSERVHHCARRRCGCATTVSVAKITLARVAARPLGWTAIGRVLHQHCKMRPFEWHRADCLSALLACQRAAIVVLRTLVRACGRNESVSASARVVRRRTGRPSTQASRGARSTGVHNVLYRDMLHLDGATHSQDSVDSYHNLRLEREGAARVTADSGRGRLS